MPLPLPLPLPMPMPMRPITVSLADGRHATLTIQHPHRARPGHACVRCILSDGDVRWVSLAVEWATWDHERLAGEVEPLLQDA